VRIKKLALRKEDLGDIAPAELAGVVGGDTSVYSCCEVNSCNITSAPVRAITDLIKTV
jgi:hypothetical protein